MDYIPESVYSQVSVLTHSWRIPHAISAKTYLPSESPWALTDLVVSYPLEIPWALRGPVVSYPLEIPWVLRGPAANYLSETL